MSTTLLEGALLAIISAHPNSHARPITDHLDRLLRQEHQRQAVATTLKRLDTTGLLKSWMSKDSESGHQARSFQLTPAGADALDAFVEILAHLLSLARSEPMFETPKIVSSPPLTPSPHALANATQHAAQWTQPPSTTPPPSTRPPWTPSPEAYVPPPALENPYTEYKIWTADESLTLLLRAQVTLDGELEENIQLILSECARQIPPYKAATYDLATYECLFLDIQDAVESTREEVRQRWRGEPDPKFQFSMWSDPRSRSLLALVGDAAFQAVQASDLNKALWANAFHADKQA